MLELVDDNAQYLVGKFSGARVQVGNEGDTIPVHPATFDRQQHEICWNDQVYRFINPDMISEDSLDALKKNNNAFVFDGDLDDLLINISDEGMSVGNVPN